MTCWSATPTRPWSPRSVRPACASRARKSSFTVAVPAVAWGDLPPRLDGPVLVAVRAAQLTAAASALAGRLHGAGYAALLRHGLHAAILAEAAGPERV